jgi:phosphoribosylamine---glycine ligase
VVLTSGGYPGKFETGKQITGLREADKVRGVKVLHAGTKCDGDKIVTSGGRVLGVTAAGTTLDESLGAVYEAAQKIHFAGAHYRKDIGAHASVTGGTINDVPTLQNPPSKKPRVGHPPRF